MLTTYSLPPAGNTAHCTARGVRTWRPRFDSLDVQHLPDGSTALTVDAPMLAAPLLFTLTPEVREHLVQLLIDAEGAPPIPAAQEAA